MHIPIVEDEKKVASFVRRALEAEQHTVDVAHDGDDGLARGSKSTCGDSSPPDGFEGELE